MCGRIGKGHRSCGGFRFRHFLRRTFSPGISSKNRALASFRHGPGPGRKSTVGKGRPPLIGRKRRRNDGLHGLRDKLMHPTRFPEAHFRLRRMHIGVDASTSREAPRKSFGIRSAMRAACDSPRSRRMVCLPFVKSVSETDGFARAMRSSCVTTCAFSVLSDFMNLRRAGVL